MQVRRGGCQPPRLAIVIWAGGSVKARDLVGRPLAIYRMAEVNIDGGRLVLGARSERHYGSVRRTCPGLRGAVVHAEEQARASHALSETVAGGGLWLG